LDNFVFSDYLTSKKSYMKPICMILILVTVCLFTQAQELVQKKHIIYSTSIRDFQGKEHRGFIATMDDSTIFMSAQKFTMTFDDLDLSSFQKYGYANIDKVSMRAGGHMKRSVLIGGIGGILVGGIVGYSSMNGENPQPQSFEIELFKVTRTQATLIGAAVGAGVGCLIGAAIGGLSNKVFKIKGKKHNLFEMKDTMIGILY
jgi:hypothetical protein